MAIRKGIGATALVACAVLGCGGGDSAGLDAGGDGGDAGGDASAPARPVAVFEPPAEGAIAWDAVPFPNDLFLGPDGTVELASLPGGNPLWQDVRERLTERRGFCRSCPVHFPVRGAIDRAGLPGRPGPGDAASIDDPVLLVDVDPDSPERGRLVPIEAEWNDDNGIVGIRLRKGIALEPGRRYAGVLTARLVSPDGAPLAPSPVFAEARDRDGGGSAAAQRAREVVGPALDYLETLEGIAREEIVSLAAFTTTTTEETLAPLEHVAAALDEAYAGGEPAAVFEPAAGGGGCEGDLVWKADDGTLDALLGTPAEAVPGLDVPPAAGTEGDTAIVHETSRIVVSGSFGAPRIVEGSGDALGMLRRAPDGTIEPAEMHRVPFLLIVPQGADVTDLPVVIFHPGVGGTRQQGLVLADTAGRAGAAVLAIDPFLHGARSSTAEDGLHWSRETSAGTLGCDGLAEAQGVIVTPRVLTAIGAEDRSQDGNPFYVLGTQLQLVSDVLALLRLVTAGQWTAIEGADASLAGLSFDADRIGFFGLSYGSFVGMAVLAIDRDIDVAALAVPGATVPDMLCEANAFRRLLSLLGSLGVRPGDYDEVTEHACMDPALGIYQWVIEPAMPIGLARYGWTDRQAAGAPPDVLMQIATLDAVIGSASTEAVAALADIPLGGERAPGFADVAPAAAPLRGNLEVDGQPVTAAAWRFGPAGHDTSHKRMTTLRWRWPIYPPLQPREPAVEGDNPIDAVHAQLEELFRTRFTDGQARIADPASL